MTFINTLRARFERRLDERFSILVDSEEIDTAETMQEAEKKAADASSRIEDFGCSLDRQECPSPHLRVVASPWW